MKMLHLVSVSNDSKSTILWTEGFDGNAPGAYATYTGYATNTLSPDGKQYSLPIHSGLFSSNSRLISNGLLILQVEFEIAPDTDFLLTTAGTETTSFTNFYWTYDEYIVSESYKAVLEQALVSGGITFFTLSQILQ